MHLSELAQDEEWFSELRREFESRIALQHRDDPQWRSGIQILLRLARNAVEYAASASSHVLDRYIRLSATLGNEANRIADESDESALLTMWGMMGIWFGEAMVSGLRKLELEHEQDALLTLSYLVWGSFYSRLELPEKDS